LPTALAREVALESARLGVAALGDRANRRGTKRH
jgi:hypothetical protein